MVGAPEPVELCEVDVGRHSSRLVRLRRLTASLPEQAAVSGAGAGALRVCVRRLQRRCGALTEGRSIDTEMGGVRERGGVRGMSTDTPRGGVRGRSTDTLRIGVRERGGIRGRSTDTPRGGVRERGTDTPRGGVRERGGVRGRSTYTPRGGGRGRSTNTPKDVVR